MPGVFLVPAMLLTVVALGAERVFYIIWNFREFHGAGAGDVALALLAGIRFDISAVAFISAPVVLISWLLFPWRQRRGVQRALLWLFFAVQIPFHVLNGIDTELVSYFGRRLNTSTFFMLGEAQGKIGSMARPMIGITLPFLAIFFVWIFSSRKLVFGERWQRWMSTASLSRAVAAQVALTVALVIGARGGLQHKPLGFAHAQIFQQSSLNNLALNSPFTLIRSAGREVLPRDHFFDDTNEMLRYLNGAVDAPSAYDAVRPAAPQNIVVILLESLNFEYMGRPHGDAGATPFLDELSAKSVFYTNAFANARRSIEGVAAVLSGVPSLMDQPFISSPYLTNHFWGVGTLLSGRNYHTSFFHSAPNGSMYFDHFMQRAGVKAYYGFNEFPDKSQADGAWGIWDDPYMQWVARTYSTFPQPFFSTIFTMSSHHPFKVPPEYDTLPKGPIPILQSIAYTDLALRHFFSLAEQQPWYRNTFFIITADHTHQSWRPEYQNELNRYRIPILLFHPSIALPHVDTAQVVSQADILPTILDVAGINPGEQNYLGRSLFVPGPRSAVNYLEGRYQLMKDGYFMAYTRDGAFRMFSREDPFQRHPLTEPKAAFDDLENTLKASIQYFSEGLWDDRLYYPTNHSVGKH